MRSVPKCCRAYSSSNKLVDVKINDKSGIAVVSMQRAPVNALNLELLTGLSDTLNELNNIQCRAMILTSVSITVRKKTCKYYIVMLVE